MHEAETGRNMYTFAYIDQLDDVTNEKEVFFYASSVFRIVFVERWDCNWFIELESVSYKDDPTMQTFLKDIQSYLYEKSGEQIPLTIGKQLLSMNRIHTILFGSSDAIISGLNVQERRSYAR